jgi:hypothetical protein
MFILLAQSVAQARGIGEGIVCSSAGHELGLLSLQAKQLLNFEDGKLASEHPKAVVQMQARTLSYHTVLT